MLRGKSRKYTLSCSDKLVTPNMTRDNPIPKVLSRGGVSKSTLKLPNYTSVTTTSLSYQVAKSLDFLTEDGPRLSEWLICIFQTDSDNFVFTNVLS